jgi:HAD superfamily hydrolase (TIGR01544 family)
MSELEKKLSNFYQLLSKKEIYVDSPLRITCLIDKFYKSNNSDLGIITDFDRTLTKAKIDGKQVNTSFMCMIDNPYVSNEFKKLELELFNKYHPIEISDTHSKEEKLIAMQEWANKNFEYCLEHKFSKKCIDYSISNQQMIYRDGFDAFQNLINRHQLETLVFSAGFGNVISESLKSENLNSDHINIISNSLFFDEDDIACSFTKPTIHVLNKKASDFYENNSLQKIKEKKNIILIGDSLGDTTMADGINYENIIKIGFYNENNFKNKYYKDYINNYDILILNDGPFDIINSFIETTTLERY